MLFLDERNDLIGDMLKSKKSTPLPGQGKPLPKGYLQRDIFQNFQKVAKDAGYLPPWLTLQKEIAVLVHQAQSKQDIATINEKIKKYNSICPPQMQRYPISLEGLEKAKILW
ncbi:DnaJ family domain-containing protein [Cytobacillus sp. FSL W7-1323]|uniref:DnaJ family domain-containing protein n=1 Tax=Cytobacillus sp. FSL W7-1323 TaxID=2921700 RepID=UPI003158A43B